MGEGQESQSTQYQWDQRPETKAAAMEAAAAHIDKHIDSFLSRHEKDGLELHTFIPPNETPAGVILYIGKKGEKIPAEFLSSVMRYVSKYERPNGWGRGDCRFVAIRAVMAEPEQGYLADGCFSAEEPGTFDNLFKYHDLNYKALNGKFVAFDLTAGYNLDLDRKGYMVLAIGGDTKEEVANNTRDFLGSKNLYDVKGEDVRRVENERLARLAEEKAYIARLDEEIRLSNKASKITVALEKEYDIFIPYTGDAHARFEFVKRLHDEFDALRHVAPAELRKVFRRGRIRMHKIELCGNADDLMGEVVLYPRFKKPYKIKVSLRKNGAFTAFVKEFAKNHPFF